MSHTLDPLTLPLWGSRLIEASAGTGKTWTIAALYVRLVLGHGASDPDKSFGRPLIPSEILVMTFTRAATRELSDRIRARLLEAARCFRGEASADGDPLMAELLAGYAPGPARKHAAWRLAMAAESMDDAAVHTIDAWCQRMLREHAFDSGCLFDETLTSNEMVMLGEASQDYWRQQIYPLTGAVLDEALAVWKSVDELNKDARALKEQVLPPGCGAGTLAECIERTLTEQAAELASLKAGWVERAQAMQTWIDGQMASKSCPFDGRRMSKAHYPRWLDALAQWAREPLLERPDVKTGETRFTPDGLREACKPGCNVDPPACFAEFEALMHALTELQPVATPIRLHAAFHIAARLAALKQQASTFGFADMLLRLDAALDPASNAEAAERLRARILAQYPVALVDEFQDTSPVQARIFDRLYRIAANDRQTALLLIGDPKQSIYGFRGADIHSYLTARRATTGQHYMLGTNHRSTASVVAAVNHLLDHPEGRDGEGAFMYRSAPAAEGVPTENPLPFLPVAARGRAERLVSADGAVPAVTLALDASLSRGAASRRAFAARCAERIAGLLNDPTAGFEEKGSDFARLRPADIAVLVRTGTEAAAVQRELRRRRVASVYLSDQQSVFASAEAQDLLHWLRAVASPLDIRLARAALATRSVGLTIAELMRLADDDEAFDERSEQLRQLHVVWQQQGVLTMLRQTLHLLDLPARWLGTLPAGGSQEVGMDGGHDGERRLTNFMHLAELLQAASGQLDGEQALVRWLAEQTQGEPTRNDDQIVRLESDADLVKVVTVHASKGLEYPLVFLPFASGFRPVERKTTRMINLAGTDGQRTLHLHLSEAHIDAADKERHREDLRLLYVALTRARHAVWVGLAALKSGNSDRCTFTRSAIGYVVHGHGDLHQDALKTQIEKLIAGCPDIVLVDAQPLEALARTPLQPREAAPALRDLEPYMATFERHWTIGSFSALVRDLPSTGAAAASVAAVRDDEHVNLASMDEAAPAAAHAAVPGNAASLSGATVVSDGGQPWHRFPRGALPGNFLHDQLEWLASEGFDLNQSPDRAEQLQRRCERQGWGERRADVREWLGEVLRTPLPPVGADLESVRAVLPEMEFWFPVDGLSASAIDTLCRDHLLAGCARPVLPERELRGMLMGFADVVFAHGGRYWVLDYKSNHLGERDADYTPEALEGAMAAHRYDVQAAVYLLALHRLLRARLGAGYDPMQHLGGAVFFFLRGVHSATHGCYHVPPSLEVLDGLDRLLQQEPEEVAP
ncbi:DNA helicase/exodeoxyribonuclease V, beta subunit [Variovorax sp. CF079]|uniref:exodeoxyribonuclease V subunit beta n=1 Tax=Variovorax sp. CF079 TaxID=1882774 RepID=UPI00089057CF|nr:exodeoxyribonuclease V subunit beta [Variovorax sp. CF079]SDC45380.1 DNA helicase/exodeoxyribonuclease V, beta subunit [Variovorax sp. CF079]